MTILVIAGIFCLFLLILFFGYNARLSKLKNSVFHTASGIKNNKTTYYIAYQKRHGVFARASNLSKKYTYLVSKDILILMDRTYDSADEAEASLIQLQEKLNAL